MKVFLPFKDESHYHYQSEKLDLETMPDGLGPGMYARVILENMGTVRHIKPYPESDKREALNPYISWTTLTDHLVKYGHRNQWTMDGTSTAMIRLIQGGADVGKNSSYWTSDLTTWSFDEGALKVWCERLALNFLLHKESPTNEMGSMTMAGMWLVEHPDVRQHLAGIWEALYAYVEYISTLPQDKFDWLKTGARSQDVLFQGHRGRWLSMDRISKNHFGAVLSTDEKKVMAWDGPAFTAAVLGMAWQVGVTQSERTRTRVFQLINRHQGHTTDALQTVRLRNQPWCTQLFTSITTGAVDAAWNVPQLVDKTPDWGELYPAKMGLKTRPLMQAFLIQNMKTYAQQEEAFIIMRKVWADFLGQHFKRGYTLRSDDRGEELLTALGPETRLYLTAGQRQTLLNEIVVYMSTRYKPEDMQYYGGTNPWERLGGYCVELYARTLDNDDAINYEDPHLNAHYLIQQFMLLVPSSMEDGLNTMLSLGASCESIGDWLMQKVLHPQVEQDVWTITLDPESSDLFSSF